MSELDLSNQKIETWSQAAAMADLGVATSLNLSKNQLTAIPPEIGNLTNLTELSLDYNQLTALPPDIGKLTNLTTLNLHRNHLTALPTEIGNLDCWQPAKVGHSRKGEIR